MPITPRLMRLEGAVWPSPPNNRLGRIVGKTSAAPAVFKNCRRLKLILCFIGLIRGAVELFILDGFNYPKPRRLESNLFHDNTVAKITIRRRGNFFKKITSGKTLCHPRKRGWA
jgi:hypothetical protein